MLLQPIQKQFAIFKAVKKKQKKYTRGSCKKIYPVCPKCKRISTKPLSVSNIVTKGFSCICSDGFSYPEKFVYHILGQVKEKFIYQANKNNTDWISNNFRYDFYIPNKKIIIETDGSQHYYSNSWGKTALENRINDTMKSEYAIHHGIEIIRLNCSISNRECLEKSIKCSKLNENYNLDLVDFDKANRFALKHSLVVEVCNYYNQNKNLTTTELGEIFNVCSGTIRRYLRTGIEIGIIDDFKLHNKKMSKDKRNYQREIASKFNSKPIYMFDLKGNFIMKFESALEAGLYINPYINPKNSANSIINCCNHYKDRYKTYKGYQFRHEQYCEEFIPISHHYKNAI